MIVQHSGAQMMQRAQRMHATLSLFSMHHAFVIALHCNKQYTNHMHAQCAMCAHERWQQQHNDNDDHNNIAMTTHQQSNSNNAMTMANDDYDDDVTMQLVRLRSQRNNNDNDKQCDQMVRRQRS